jgi:hypothetical protein
MKYPLIAVALLASAAAFAGDSGCGHGDHMARLTEDLGLDAAQATQVEQILESSHERMRAEHKAIHEDTLAQLRNVLTEEQVQALEARWKEHGPGRRHHRSRDAEETGA